MRNAPRWLLRVLDLFIAWEAVEWMLGGGFCLAIAVLVWREPIPPGDDGLLLAAGHYRNVGVALFATFGIVLVGVGLRELASLTRSGRL